MNSVYCMYTISGNSSSESQFSYLYNGKAISLSDTVLWNQIGVCNVLQHPWTTDKLLKANVKYIQLLSCHYRMNYTIPKTYSEFCPFLHHLVTQYSRRGRPIFPAPGICILLYFFYRLSAVFYGCIHTCKFSPNKWATARRWCRTNLVRHAHLFKTINCRVLQLSFWRAGTCWDAPKRRTSLVSVCKAGWWTSHRNRNWNIGCCHSSRKNPQILVHEFKVHSLYKPCFLFFSRTAPAVRDRKYCCNF